MRLDAKMLNAVEILIGQGEEWPTDGTAHLGRDEWELAKDINLINRISIKIAKERLRIPKRLGGPGLTDATSKCPLGRVACGIDCVWRGPGMADARNQGTSNPAPARIPLFPATLLNKMRRATGGSLVGMEPLLSLQTSIGEAFEVNWATCQQLADEGSQLDPTQIETPLNWHLIKRI